MTICRYNFHVLEDRRSTSETKIKSDRIFISNYQIWNKIHRWEFGFLPEDNSEKTNQTNFLVILLDEDTAEFFAQEIDTFSSYNPELLSKMTNNAQNKLPDLERLLATNECKERNLSNVDFSNSNIKA